MKIENWSARHPIWKLRPLLRFACRRTAHHEGAVLILEDHTDSRRLTSGQAWRRVIDLYLSSGTARYPRRTKHVDEVGWIRLASWEEEVLLVLSHELRHIDQFADGKSGDLDWAEVDAEKFAVETLRAYRHSLRI